MKKDLILYFKTDNKDGKKSKEKWLIKNNNVLYQDIVNWTNKILDLKNIEFKRKIYHYVNDIIDIPKCYCGNFVNFKNVNDGYSQYCSDKCVKSSVNYYKKWSNTTIKNNSMKNGILKRNETIIKKYGSLENYNIFLKERRRQILNEKLGVDNVFQLNYVKDKSKKTKIEKYGYEFWNNKDKTRLIRIKNGTQINDDLINSFLDYKKIIVNRSTTIYRNNTKEINPNNLKRGIKHYHIDHKYSIKQGFLNNIPIEIITHPCNLNMIWWKDNLEKQDRCDINMNELISNILEYKNCVIIKQSTLNNLYQKENIQKLIEKYEL